MNYAAFRKASFAAVFSVWLLVMGLLVHRVGGFSWKQGSSLGSAASFPSSMYSEQWMGVYYRGSKIGWASQNVEKNGEGIKVSELVSIRLTMMGQVKDLRTETVVFLDRYAALESFTFSLHSDADMKVSGKAEGNSVNLQIDASGVRSSKTLTFKEKPSLDLSLAPLLLKNGLVKGKKFRLPSFDPSTMGSAVMEVEVEDREKLRIMDSEVDAFRIRGNMNGSGFTIWLSENGEILKQDSTLGFTFIKEKKETAMSGAAASGDLTEQLSVPFNLKLPQGVLYLKTKVSGVDLKNLDMDGGSQRLSGDMLEIRSPRPDKIRKTPISGLSKGDGKGEYLKASIFIQSADPDIVTLSAKIRGRETDGLAVAKLVSDWVYKNIKKTPSVTIPTATEVLKTSRGDCNEHSVLFAALSRASGIPTRIAMGVVYNEGRFYYHAWPEIFIDGWIGVDPTLGQFPADASHVRLIAGDMDDQTRIMQAVGNLRLEGLEYR